MSWLPILALAALAFLTAAFVLKLPRGVWTLFGAALMFGLAGYALQGSPGQGGAPRQTIEREGETGEAMVASRRALFSASEMPSRFVVTADAFTRRGDHESAAQFLRNAVEENPDDTEAWVALGNALTEHAEGQLTAPAMYAFTRAQATDPGNPAAGYFAGFALLRSGQVEQARTLWAETIANAPEGADWVEGMAQRLEWLNALLAQERVPAGR